MGIGSDHTDRVLEATSVQKTKQVCSKPISKIEVEPFYIFTTFFIAYSTGTIGFSRTTALNVITISTLVTTLCIPLMGMLPDKIVVKGHSFKENPAR